MAAVAGTHLVQRIAGEARPSSLAIPQPYSSITRPEPVPVDGGLLW